MNTFNAQGYLLNRLILIEMRADKHKKISQRNTDSLDSDDGNLNVRCTIAVINQFELSLCCDCIQRYWMQFYLNSYLLHFSII